jgi:hypothetical protein
MRGIDEWETLLYQERYSMREQGDEVEEESLKRALWKRRLGYKRILSIKERQIEVPIRDDREIWRDDNPSLFNRVTSLKENRRLSFQ